MVETLKPDRAVDFGQPFVPFENVDLAGLVESQGGLSSKEYRLNGVGLITVSLKVELSMDYVNPDQVPQFIDIDENGRPRLSKLASELYELDVIVDYNSISPDPNFVCAATIGDLELKSENAEKEDPVSAGFAVFYSWQPSSGESPTDLLISSKCIPNLKIRFDRGQTQESV